MVAAFEVLIANPAVRNLLRDGKTNQLRNVITTSQQEGMMTLENSLGYLVSSGVISYEAALAVSMHPRDLARAVDPALTLARN
jgi:twitching motility protein PilT